MRMWMVDPKILCRKHLLGEHVETHMFIGSIKRGLSMEGYVKNNLLEESSIYERHNVLVQEMNNRNMNHNSELPLITLQNRGIVDKELALKELLRRCEDCAERYKNGTCY